MVFQNIKDTALTIFALMPCISFIIHFYIITIFGRFANMLFKNKLFPFNPNFIKFIFIPMLFLMINFLQIMIILDLLDEL